MPNKVLLLADDLTGACDAAVHFAMRGLETSAAVDLEHARAEAEVWCINLESRDCLRGEIGPRMAQAAAALPVGPGTVIFKKIDSTLRGNAGFETVAAMKAFGSDLAIFTPALPALGRTVECGILRVAAPSTFQPIAISDWLRAQDIECGETFVAADAACDADLDRIVAEGLASGKRILWSGSAGLAAALARTMGRGGAKSQEQGARRPGPVVFAIGSTHPVTVEQVERLDAQHTVILIPRGGPIDSATLARAGALVLSGGDTASAVCRALGAERIALAGEILPGIPWGILRGGTADGIPVATKSGGFGAPDALIRVSEFFHAEKTG